jgi:hypothetical protein
VWLPSGLTEQCVKKQWTEQCVKKQCFGARMALDLRLSRVGTGVGAMGQDRNYPFRYHENGGDHEKDWETDRQTHTQSLWYDVLCLCPVPGLDATVPLWSLAVQGRGRKTTGPSSGTCSLETSRLISTNHARTNLQHATPNPYYSLLASIPLPYKVLLSYIIPYQVISDIPEMPV